MQKIVPIIQRHLIKRLLTMRSKYVTLQVAGFLQFRRSLFFIYLCSWLFKALEFVWHESQNSTLDGDEVVERNYEVNSFPFIVHFHVYVSFKMIILLADARIIYINGHYLAVYW